MREKDFFYLNFRTKYSLFWRDLEKTCYDSRVFMICISGRGAVPMRKISLLLVILCLFLAGCGAQEEPEQFTFDEVSDVFDLTEVDIQQMYGEPNEVNEDQLYGFDYQRFVFGENQFGFCNYNDGTFALCEAVIADERISGPRDVCLGDSLKEVRKKYPDQKNKEVYPLEGYQGKEQKVEYRVLYGEYIHMSDFGIEVEAEDGTKTLEYSNEGVILRYHFTDDILTSMEYVAQVL